MEVTTVTKLIMKFKLLGYNEFEINYYLTQGLDVILTLFPDILT